MCSRPSPSTITASSGHRAPDDSSVVQRREGFQFEIRNRTLTHRVCGVLRCKHRTMLDAPPLKPNAAGEAMKLAKVAVASALVLASAGSFSAALGSIDLSSGSGFFGNTPIAGSFTDTLTFTVTTLSTFNGSITSAVNGTQDVDFTSIVVTPGSLAFVSMLGDPVELWA